MFLFLLLSFGRLTKIGEGENWCFWFTIPSCLFLVRRIGRERAMDRWFGCIINRHFFLFSVRLIVHIFRHTYSPFLLYLWVRVRVSILSPRLVSEQVFFLLRLPSFFLTPLYPPCYYLYSQLGLIFFTCVSPVSPRGKEVAFALWAGGKAGVCPCLHILVYSNRTKGHCR